MARKNLYKEDYDIPRLCRAIEASLQSQQPYREERLEVVKRAAGNHYGEQGGKNSTAPLRFINFLSQFRSIISRQLVPQTPRIIVGTHNFEGKSVADSLETWANIHFQKTYFGDKLRRIALDALDCIGIAMVALADPADASEQRYETQAGEPFCARIDIEDFVFDPRCKELQTARWMGHFFRTSVEVANLMAEKGRKESFEGEDPQDYNTQGDEKVGLLGRGTSIDNDEYEEMVGFWNIWLPLKGVIVTLKAGEDGLPIQDHKPVKITRWVGPPCGPYHFLYFDPVPGNPMPSPPVHHVMDLDELLNRCLRKLADQAGNQKEFTAVSAGASSEDGDGILAVKDGDVREFDDVDSIKQVRMGGPDQINLAFSMKVLQWANRQAGNLDTLAGLATMAGTARQEAQLANNASQSVVNMLDATLTFIESVSRAYLWLYYHHPYEVMKAPYEVPGYPEVSTNRLLGPDKRYQIPWDELDLRVDPYAAQHQTPQQKIAFVNSVMDRMAAREQMLAAQGVFLDASAYMRLMSKWGDVPELSDIYVSRSPMMPQTGGMPQSTGPTGMGEDMGAGTGSEMNDQGQEEAEIQKLLGSDPGGDPNASPSLVPVE